MPPYNASTPPLCSRGIGGRNSCFGGGESDRLAASWHRGIGAALAPPSGKRFGLAIFVGVAVAVAAWFFWKPSSRPAARRDRGFEIYLLGSSTALGYPYFPRADVGRIARLLIAEDGVRRVVRVVNKAGPGKTARVVLRDARELAELGAPTAGAVAFLYIGNNEFLRYDRRPDLTKKQRDLFDETVVSATERARIVRRYAEQLEETIRVLRLADITVVVSTVAVNLADWMPNRSVLAQPDHADAVRTWIEAGDWSLARHDWTGALAAFENVLRLEPTFALASKRTGDCYRALGDLGRARQSYRDAVDHDGNPLRETSDLEAALRSVCARLEVPVVDTARLLATAAPDGIPGFETFWDNCHPNLEAYTAIARAFVAVLDSLFGIEGRDLGSHEIRELLAIDSEFEQQVLHLEGQYCYAASALVFDPKERLSRARLYLERADSLADDADVVSSLAVLAAMEDNLSESLQHWRRAVQLDVRLAHERMLNHHVIQVMSRLGVEDLARAIE